MSKKYSILSKEERQVQSITRSDYMKVYMKRYNRKRGSNNSKLDGYIFSIEECKKMLSEKIKLI